MVAGPDGLWTWLLAGGGLTLIVGMIPKAITEWKRLRQADHAQDQTMVAQVMATTTGFQASLIARVGDLEDKWAEAMDQVEQARKDAHEARQIARQERAALTHYIRELTTAMSDAGVKVPPPPDGLSL